MGYTKLLKLKKSISFYAIYDTTDSWYIFPEHLAMILMCCPSELKLTGVKLGNATFMICICS